MQTYLYALGRCEDNLGIIPRLIRSFLRFLIKNSFFPERPDERRFQNALKIAELAYKELPFTSSTSKFLPDEFGKACREYWGSQTQSFWSDEESDGDETGKSEDSSGSKALAHIKSKITHISFDDEANDQDELAGKCEDDDTNAPPAYPTTATVPESFKSLLSATGPFPVTHRPRFAERSLRRITRVLPPGGFVSAVIESNKTEPSSNSIYVAENDLNSMLAKLILVPWVDSGLHGYTKPEVVDITKLRRDATEAPGAPEDHDHDPLEDDIAVLVSVASRNLEVLRDSIGMGLAGTWVQLMPDGGGEWSPERLKYWYLDSLDAVVPSYWTC